MGRKLPFLPTCGSPSKTLSFRAAAAATADFDDTVATDSSSIESVIQGLCTDRFFFKPGKTSSILEEAKPKEVAKLKEKEQQKEKVNEISSNGVSMMEMESTDPFVDFKKSMQEMVEADEGLKEWENLQELLSLYLAVNDKINHGYIIGAFVDVLLLNLGSQSSSSSCSSSSSSMNGQDQSLSTTEYGSTSNSSSSNNTNNNNHLKNKKKMIISCSESESVSFTSSTSSTSCSLEEDEEEEDDDDGDDHNSPQKVVVVVS